MSLRCLPALAVQRFLESSDTPAPTTSVAKKLASATPTPGNPPDPSLTSLPPPVASAPGPGLVGGTVTTPVASMKAPSVPTAAGDMMEMERKLVAVMETYATDSVRRLRTVEGRCGALDTELRGMIKIETDAKAEMNARLTLAIEKVGEQLVAGEDARTGAVGTLNAAIDVIKASVAAERKDRDTAVKELVLKLDEVKESVTKTNAAHDSQISGLQGEIGNVRASFAAETTARDTAVKDLNLKLDEVKGLVTSTDAASDLKITALTSGIDNVKGLIAAETTARDTAVKDLSLKLEEVKGLVTSTDAASDLKITALTSGIDNVKGLIAAETTARDTAVKDLAATLKVSEESTHTELEALKKEIAQLRALIVSESTARNEAISATEEKFDAKLQPCLTVKDLFDAHQHEYNGFQRRTENSYASLIEVVAKNRTHGEEAVAKLNVSITAHVNTAISSVRNDLDEGYRKLRERIDVLSSPVVPGSTSAAPVDGDVTSRITGLDDEIILLKSTARTLASASELSELRRQFNDFVASDSKRVETQDEILRGMKAFGTTVDELDAFKNSIAPEVTKITAVFKEMGVQLRGVTEGVKKADALGPRVAKLEESFADVKNDFSGLSLNVTEQLKDANKKICALESAESVPPHDFSALFGKVGDAFDEIKKLQESLRVRETVSGMSGAGPALGLTETVSQPDIEDEDCDVKSEYSFDCDCTGHVPTPVSPREVDPDELLSAPIPSTTSAVTTPSMQSAVETDGSVKKGGESLKSRLEAKVGKKILRDSFITAYETVIRRTLPPAEFTDTCYEDALRGVAIPSVGEPTGFPGRIDLNQALNADWFMGSVDTSLLVVMSRFRAACNNVPMKENFLYEKVWPCVLKHFLSYKADFGWIEKAAEIYSSDEA